MNHRAFLLPPHRITRPEQVDALAADMRARGWVGDPLIGYWDDTLDAIQLLSGTHRFAAAAHVGLSIPVIVRDKAAVSEAWGDLAAWSRIMDPQS